MGMDAYIGQRRSYDGNLCTVRYLGDVRGTTGQWIGVEWDDPSRGKHAGERESVKYFSCISRSTATPASFIRPTRPADAPREFVEAVKYKYASAFGAHGVYSVQGFQQPDSNIRISGKEVEEVGFDKIRRQLANLRQLRILLVDTLLVHRPAAQNSVEGKTPSTDVFDTFPNVFELDLSRNLFEQWAEVVDICRQLPQLTSLKSDGNRFASVELRVPASQLQTAPFTNIKTLGLDDTLLNWKDVARICESVPAIEELSACGNEYEFLEDVSLPPSLITVNLERNDFPSFRSLVCLGRLNSIQRLSLKSNAIRFWDDDDEGNPSGLPSFPPSLDDLDIAYNKISSWRLIDQLAFIFPGLKSLRVSHNPLYEDLKAPSGKLLMPEDGYMLTLARIGRLERLNYSVINPKERLNAEIYYLSQIKQEITGLPPGSSPEPCIGQHARYAELSAKYPDSSALANNLQPRTTNQVDPNSLAANLITLTMKLDLIVSERAAGIKDTWIRRIPRSCTIYTLQGLIGKHFNLPPMQLQLIWETGEEDIVPLNFEDDSSNSDENNDSAGKVHESKSKPRPAIQHPPKRLREEILTPRMRSLGTWADDLRSGEDGAAATAMGLRVEWDALCLKRAKKAAADVGLPMQGVETYE